MADDEQRLAQQVYLVIKADVTADRKNRNSQVLGVYFAGARSALMRASMTFFVQSRPWASFQRPAAL